MFNVQTVWVIGRQFLKWLHTTECSLFRRAPGVRSFYLCLTILCLPSKILGNISQFTSALIRSEPATFLEQTFGTETWFEVGVTNNDRSPEFIDRLRDASATNAPAQGYLGMLLVKGDG